MFSFYNKRRWFFGFSLLLILVGLFSAVFFGVELDIEFKGGSIIKYGYSGELDLKLAEDTISQAIGMNVSCQEVTSLGDHSTSLVVNVAGNEALPQEKQALLEKALEASFPDLEFALQSANLVDPFIGRELLVKGVWAIAITSVLIVACLGHRLV